jgi:putative oxidoreductase
MPCSAHAFRQLLKSSLSVSESSRWRRFRWPLPSAGASNHAHRHAPGEIIVQSARSQSIGTFQSLDTLKGNGLNKLTDWLIGWPERVARHLQWLAPLFARVVVGWVFMWSGWGKLQNLPAITENFIGWHIPAPHILAPFVSGVELFGGIFLLLGLMTRISAGALGVTMIVAIASAKWADVDSLETFLGFDETEYLALFLWLAIAGAGTVSLDWLLGRKRRPL